MNGQSYRAQRFQRMTPLEILQTLKCQVALGVEMLQTGNFTTADIPRELHDGDSLGVIGDFEIRIRKD